MGQIVSQIYSSIKMRPTKSNSIFISIKSLLLVKYLILNLSNIWKRERGRGRERERELEILLTLFFKNLILIEINFLESISCTNSKRFKFRWIERFIRWVQAFPNSIWRRWRKWCQLSTILLKRRVKEPILVDHEIIQIKGILKISKVFIDQNTIRSLFWWPGFWQNCVLTADLQSTGRSGN
jgi:hypothetical protein